MTYSKEELDPSTGNYKKYFDLTTIKRQDKEKYPKGITYKVRYKFDLSGKRIPQGKVTYTTKTAIFEEAVKLGFDNRFEILRNYVSNKDKPPSGKAFFKMLNDYYEDDSKYLKDDSSSNKRDVVYRARREARLFIKNDLIPYLLNSKVNQQLAFYNLNDTLLSISALNSLKVSNCGVFPIFFVIVFVFAINPSISPSLRAHFIPSKAA
jgi:hypothetical protein